MADHIFNLELPALPVYGAGDGAAKEAEAATLEALGDMARQVWIALAAKSLGRTRRTYINAIQKPVVEGRSAVVTLVGAEANAVERGSPAYDMRTTLLGPRVPVVPARQGQRGKHRSKKGGFWRVIPFSHQGASGTGATGTPLGAPYAEMMGAAEAKAFGKRVQAAASRLAPTFERPDRTMQWGGRLSGKKLPKLRPHHTTSIYTGMVRVAKDYKNEKTGRTTRQFTTRSFRTISTAVARGWMRRATPGAQLLQQVKAHMEKEAPAYLSSIS